MNFLNTKLASDINKMKQNNRQKVKWILILNQKRNCLSPELRRKLHILTMLPMKNIIYVINNFRPENVFLCKSDRHCCLSRTK